MGFTVLTVLEVLWDMRKVAAAALTDVTAGWDRAQVGEQVLVGGESYLTTSLH